MEKLKKCSKCGRELPVSEFWKNASTEDGLQTYCKECGNVYARNRKKTPGGGTPEFCNQFVFTRCRFILNKPNDGTCKRGNDSKLSLLWSP